MLNKRTYFIFERFGFLKLTGTYDILDPETTAQLDFLQEETEKPENATRP